MGPKNHPLIMKFGGACLKTVCHVIDVAQAIAEKRKSCPSLVIVVSAMDKMTDQLMELARQVAASPPQREQDMLVSVGERISMTLLAMALKEKGVDAVSLTGSQSGIITCHRHGQARICDVRPCRIIEQLNQGKVVIVAGFQGMSLEREITTLGRGGSDTTAVALAVALQGRKVEFYKDVAGVYDEDPHKHAGAKLFSWLCYEKAIEMAKSGSFVLSLRAILLALKNKVPLHVLGFERGKSGQAARFATPFCGTVISLASSAHLNSKWEDEKDVASSAGAYE